MAYVLHFFNLRLRPKAEVFQGRTFGYNQRWKLHLRSNTVLILSQQIVKIIFKKSSKKNMKNCGQKNVNKIEVNRISKILRPSPFYAVILILFKYTSTYCVPKLPSNKQHQREPSSENYLFWKLVWPQLWNWNPVHFY